MGKVLYLKKGETHTIPTTGILASTLAVGSTVKLLENGTPVEYLVVNQGIPSNSNLYDSSCDGTWLLRKDVYEMRQWNSSDRNNYGASTVHTHLNSTFLNLFGSVEHATIRQVKLPYSTGTSNSNVSSGTNGLSTKIFAKETVNLGKNVNILHI
jgi:hypothetical protein